MRLTQKSLDIIVPSYRFDINTDNIISIVSLKYPEDWNVCFYIIGDNPNVPVPAKIEALAVSGKMIFSVNESNRGLNYSRNKGIDISNGEWLLLLDDDIIPKPDLLFSYINAIKKNPGAIGFAGVVSFPVPENNFTKALQTAGYTHFFSLPKFKASLPWATGANILFNRNKIGQLRFSLEFSNSEGGDEVEFAIRLKQQQRTDIISVCDAEVLHPWWHNGKVNYLRAFKYSRGNYKLLKLHPEFTTYRFCNLVELVLLLLLFLPAFLVAGVTSMKWALFIFIIIFIDAVLHSIKLIKEKKVNPVILFHTWVLKLAEQTGYTSACLTNFFLQGVFKKFDIELREKQNHFHTNRWLLIKTSLFVIAGFIILAA